MISVILPTYNGEKYIRESIDSILNQTYKNIELIIVNDCSVDSTYEILKDYEKKDKRIKIVNNTKNQGLPNSLNIGFAHAKGEFFTWTSDDNFYKSNALEEMMKTMLEKKADFVYAACNIINGKGTVIGKGATNYIKNLPKANCIWACFLYRRKVYDIIGNYNPDLRLMEDYDYWLRIYENNFKMEYLPHILYNYRKHQNSLTATRQNDILKMENRVRSRHLKIFLFQKKDNFKVWIEDLYNMFEGLAFLNKKLNLKRQYIYSFMTVISAIVLKKA